MSSYWKYPWFVLVAVLILRLAVGFHFFREGWTKLEDGFSSAGFFGAAVGPFAPAFHSLTPDPQGKERLGYGVTEDGRPSYDLTPTKSAWKAFRDRAIAGYQIGDAKWIEAEKARKAELEADLKAAREAKDGARESDLKHEIVQTNAALARLSNQQQRLDQILNRYNDQLDYLFALNDEEILTYFRDLDRVVDYRANPGWTGTSSIEGQVDKVAGDAKKKATPWLRSIDAMWDDYEAEVNALATPSQIDSAGGPLALRRPWLSRPNTTWIDGIVPYFDLTIGALLIVGLFSRAAGFFAAGFLFTIVLTQWPWADGAAPVYYQFVEFAAALCLMAFPSGQFLGLDGLLRSLYLRLTSKREAERAPRPAAA